jgi:hypothetical protein
LRTLFYLLKIIDAILTKKKRWIETRKQIEKSQFINLNPDRNRDVIQSSYSMIKAKLKIIKINSIQICFNRKEGKEKKRKMRNFVLVNI